MGKKLMTVVTLVRHPNYQQSEQGDRLPSVTLFLTQPLPAW